MIVIVSGGYVLCNLFTALALADTIRFCRSSAYEYQQAIIEPIHLVARLKIPDKC